MTWVKDQSYEMILSTFLYSTVWDRNKKWSRECRNWLTSPCEAQVWLEWDWIMSMGSACLLHHESIVMEFNLPQCTLIPEVRGRGLKPPEETFVDCTRKILTWSSRLQDDTAFATMSIFNLKSLWIVVNHEVDQVHDNLTLLLYSTLGLRVDISSEDLQYQLKYRIACSTHGTKRT